VDAATSITRQRYVFNLLLRIMIATFNLADKNEARTYFNQLRQVLLDLNGSEIDSDKFQEIEHDLLSKLAAKHKESKEELDEIFSGLFV